MLFKHSGDLDDIIFSLATVKAMGGGILYLDINGGANEPLVAQFTPRRRTRFDSAAYQFIRPFLLEQDYLQDVRVWQGEKIDCNLDQFRPLVADKGPNPAVMHLRAFRLDESLGDGKTPWLTVKSPPIKLGKPNALYRTARRHSQYFCWKQNIEMLTKASIFVGPKPEHEIFQYTFGWTLDLHVPQDALEVARIILGSERIIGNESFAMAIGIGLGTEILMEKFDYGPKWDFMRPNVAWMEVIISDGPPPEPRPKVVAAGRDLTFKHSGDLGDIVYALPAIKGLGGGVLYLDTGCGQGDPWVQKQSIQSRTKFDASQYACIRPLLMEQPYIRDVRVWNGEAVDYNLNEVRNYMHPRNNLVAEYLAVFGLDLELGKPPWLTLKSAPLPLHKSVVVNRTPRWHAKDHIWEKDLPEFVLNAVFVGYPMEHSIFQYTFDCKLDLHVPRDALELARILKACRVCVANQSFVMAVAIGLGTPFIQEVSDYVPNCVFPEAYGRYF